MNRILTILLLLCCIPGWAQQKRFVLRDAETRKEYPRTDSLSAVKFLDSLSENSHYFTRVVSVAQKGSVTYVVFDKGQNFNRARVYLHEETARALKMQKEFTCQNLDSLKRHISSYYVSQGYVFNRIKAVFLKSEDQLPHIRLGVIKGPERRVGGLVVQGYTKVPSRFVKNLEKRYVGQAYRPELLEQLAGQLSNQAYVQLEKPPQTLFTRDSTQIYLTLQKKKNSYFDGILGFGNDQNNKIAFNGTLNLDLKNVFNGFESISVFWQRTPQAGQQFDLLTDVPYLLKSNLGTRLSMNIYRQDSTFANFRFRPSLYYEFSGQQKLGLRASIELSSALLQGGSSAEDFSKRGIGMFYQFLKPSTEVLLQYTTFISAEADLLTVDYQQRNSIYGQQQYQLTAEHNLRLAGSHYLNIKAESAWLNSEAEAAANELFRIGGYRSLRGFNEQSLFTDFYGFGGLEYRYLVGNEAFFDVFGQFATVRNSVLRETRKLYSMGLGFNFMLPLGLMTLQVSNGQEAGSPFRFQDTKIHWGVVAKF